MLNIRQLTACDIPRGMELKDQAGWNQTEADWRRFVELEPGGCFAAEWDGRVVGTVAAVTFGPVAWIAMVLVDIEFRGRGIGTRLVQHALDYLGERGVRTVRLDATSLGAAVYRRLGFVPQYELARWEGVAPSGTCHPCVRPILPEQLDAVARLDAEATGNDRERLIRLLYRQQPEAMQVFHFDGRLDGYATWREGSRAAHLGPVIARIEDVGRALCEAILADCAGRRVFIDIPSQNSPAVAWAESKGFVGQRRFTRMYRGQTPLDHPLWLWASSGPENG